jgi:Protein of unknown function (DUF3093)
MERMVLTRRADDARSYHERMLVPVSWWLFSVPLIVLFGAELYAGFSGIVPPLIYAGLIVIVGGFLLAWGAVSVAVADGVLRVGHASLQLSQVGEVAALDDKQAALVRGPRADPAAYVVLRPYLKRAVYIELADPGGQVPYWLVATRRPAELAAAIERSRQTVG